MELESPPHAARDRERQQAPVTQRGGRSTGDTAWRQQHRGHSAAATAQGSIGDSVAASIGHPQRQHRLSTTPQVLSPTIAAPPNALPRRSSRLFTSDSSTTKENSKKLKMKFPPKIPNRKTKSKTNKGGVTQANMNESLEISKLDSSIISEGKISGVGPQIQALTIQRAAAEGLMSLLRDMGKGYVALCSYNCKEAINILSHLPSHHYNTGWVLCQIGRAYFELAEYLQAERVFSEVRRIENYRVEGMEIYSTTLWHLQKDVALSVLSKDLTDMDKNSPEAWCAAGNCFSLQREHDIAIKFFQRAIQVDPGYAYAFTLLGHEFVLTEELDKALACFRNAIRVNPRHYNAWYGLGMIYYKQEKFSLAEMHFQKALDINPQSSVLLCHIGVVQHALKKSDKALDTLNKAISIDPKNPLCKFHRASILFANEKYKSALQELEELKQIVPKESLVYFLIGKVYKKLGQTHLALMNFSWAMDLDPKGANNQIKEAIDKRYLPDDEEAVTQEEQISECYPYETGQTKYACAGAVAEDQKRTSWKEDGRSRSGPDTPIRPDQQRDRPPGGPLSSSDFFIFCPPLCQSCSNPIVPIAQDPPTAPPESDTPIPGWASTLSQSVADLTRVSQTLVSVLDRLPLQTPAVVSGSQEPPPEPPLIIHKRSRQERWSESSSRSISPHGPPLRSESPRPSSPESGEAFSDAPSEDISELDSNQIATMREMVQNLIGAVNQSCGIKDPSTEPADQAVSFRRAKPPSKFFAPHPEFEEIMSRERENPTRRFQRGKRLGVLYPFSPERTYRQLDGLSLGGSTCVQAVHQHGASSVRRSISEGL
ncbi:unnamed protein product [Ranitomeya imitator]|uniref:Cell division cycle protein 27 homolog n=1 Tax=Ranitomeya imitator TaxID=111125 RepID=A0ABN9KYW7_9NEOB|nr:unnamed protein product [Ranitomeya imitator]